MTTVDHPEVEKERAETGMTQKGACRHLGKSLASLGIGTFTNCKRSHPVGSVSLCPLSAPARTAKSPKLEAEMRFLAE